jgi:hypothetical protein
MMGTEGEADAHGDRRMGTRTVRLDAAAEATLADLQRRTGLSISDVMRKALRAYTTELDADIRRRPGEVYRSLGLPGEGGYAVAPARRAKEVIADVIRKRHEQ